jgi:hypothetical protein
MDESDIKSVARVSVSQKFAKKVKKSDLGPGRGHEKDEDLTMRSQKRNPAVISC